MIVQNANMKEFASEMGSGVGLRGMIEPVRMGMVYSDARRASLIGQEKDNAKIKFDCWSKDFYQAV